MGRVIYELGPWSQKTDKATISHIFSAERVLQTTRGDADLAAIAVSASARSEDVDKALKEGFYAHISKPVDCGGCSR